MIRLYLLIMGPSTAELFSAPHRISTTFSVHSIAVPGPRDETTLPSTTTLETSS
eukprot:m.156695 g.156695  ORF g.156695 m.156695 type:complete len:54 (+) comp14442_c0_seq1:109-270(+)